MRDEIKAGECFIKTDGEYEYYQVTSIMSAKKDFSLREEIKNFFKSGKKQEMYFHSWLKENGFVESVQYFEVRDDGGDVIEVTDPDGEWEKIYAPA